MMLATVSDGPAATQPFLDLLRSLTLPRHVMYIGPGSTRNPWIRWLDGTDIEYATLIDASEEAARSLQPLIGRHPAWRVHDQLVGPRRGPVTFHAVPVAGESGIVDPEALRAVWPNLRSRHHQLRDAVSVADLLAEAASPPDWLLVDCLPAADLLASAENALQDTALIVMRCLTADAASVSGASLAASDALLHRIGFRRGLLLPEKHPALCHAFYVRDLGEEHPKVRRLVDAAVRVPMQRASDLETRHAGAVAQIASLTQERKTLADQVAAGAQLARELVEQVQALKQRSAETHQMDALQQAKKQLEEAAAQRQQQIRTLDQRVAQLQTQLDDAERLNQKLRAEVDKAESQIALIREFLLKESPP